MQDRYAGDIGDYFKLSLVRRLAAGRRLGVAWYLHPDEDHNEDGRHVGYLRDADRWREADPVVFDFLVRIANGPRRVEALQGVFQAGTLFASETVPGRHLSKYMRCGERSAWFKRTQAALETAGIVFADPDNGLVSDNPLRRLDQNFAKRLPISEVRALGTGRPVIVYHHNSRFKGGHAAEIDFWMERLGRSAIGIRCNAYSCRTFLVVDPDDELRERAHLFCQDWRNHKVTLHENSA